MKKHLKILLTVILFFIYSDVSFGIKLNDNKNDKIANQTNIFMKHCYDAGLFNGCVLVSKDNEILYKEALGYADIFNQIPLSIDSKYDIGSLTKSFTAASIMILEEKGKLSYDDKLSSYFQEFPDYANKITIHHLLCHQSGISDYSNDLAMRWKELSEEIIINRLVKEELMFEPGTNSRYSNSGYFLLARIIEKVSGMSYREFIEQYIFEPLKMKNSTVLDNEHAIIKGKAVGRNFTLPDEKTNYITGPGGIYTTVGDLYKWHQALFESEILSQHSIDRATTPSLLSDGNETREGYGWHINYKNDIKLIAHGGASPDGYISYLVQPASGQYSIILLTNFFRSQNFGIVLNGLTSIINGSEFKEIKTPAMYKLNKYIIEKGIKNIDLVFKQYNTDTLSYTPFDELEFIKLSSFYKNRNRFNEAVAILNIYRVEFPESLIPLEELAEIYKLAGTQNLLKRNKKGLEDLVAKLSKRESIEFHLVNPSTEDYQMSLNVRFGHGSKYESISLIKSGEAYTVVGRSMNGKWLKLKREGWVYYRTGRISKDQFNSLPFMRFEEK